MLSQSGVSHSALVNSGNAAILGHQSFKLNNGTSSNTLAGGGVGAVGGAGGPAVTLGSTYGVIGSSQ